LKTREIYIGNLALGGTNPVRIQSMTNTNTMDTVATVRQTIELADAGCELVRITARNKSEAENLRNIKSELHSRGYKIPLIADIHFQPNAAEVAARIVEKVRINPGNYIDKQPSGIMKIDFSETEYHAELEKIHNRLLPLINICKEYRTAIRIGVNHGSLSARVTARYGDTPEGMVVSALEYIEMFVAEGFHNLVLSMKSSDVKTMIYSYRLLASRMMEHGYNYPLHLGVTEAGAGIDARIKSSAGIGELLMEGIGDTIRVSLTENPVNEIAVARILRDDFAANRNFSADSFHRGYSFQKAETISIKGIGSNHPPVILGTQTAISAESKYKPDFIFEPDKKVIMDGNEPIPTFIIDACDHENFVPGNDAVIIYDISRCTDLLSTRQKLFALKDSGNKCPVVLYKRYGQCSPDQLRVLASAEFAFFLTDGLLGGICIDAAEHAEHLPALMFSILQAIGLRRIKAEFIACPTCGRTSYDVEGTLHEITLRLSHLKHLKIGVMGCIVNGPGEMADADYGYVGSAPKKINLYKGKTLVSKNIPESVALEELIKIIKENGDWMEA
jgi:(E)-4-hydroxy-3-methylbut-2-enyl-diphosphate synthase